MLINAVLVYIRELLPVLLLIAVLLQLQPKRQLQLLLYALLCSVVVMLLLAPWLSEITQLFDGNGLELMFAVAQLVTLCSLLILVLKPGNLFIAVLAIVSQVVLCGVNLLLYSLTSTGESAVESLWLGAVLGVGIGISIAVLWYHLLAELERFGEAVLLLMLALIAARQSSEIALLLGQIDWLPSGPSLWDSSNFISEQAEVGVFFHAWFGYEATPDLTQLGSWLFTQALMFMLWWWRRVKQ